MIRNSSINNKYTIIKKIGEGAFGIVYKGTDNDTGKKIAIKIENTNKSRLKYENAIYKYMKGVLGFPKIYDCIHEQDEIIFIMEYLGPNLDSLFEFCGRRFSLKTVLMISIQVLNRIEVFHNKGFIHRDIKPDNFLIGIDNKKSRIYMIDFGLSKKIISSEGVHIPYRNDKSFTGSYRYSSIRNHKGIEQSRRDDLESIGYMLIYFLSGRLPWQGLKCSNKSKRKFKIYNIKQTVSLEELCKKVPNEFLLYMKYCRVLQFTDKPDYAMLKELFLNLFKKRGYNLDFIYDWNTIAKNKKRKLKYKKNTI